MAAWSLSELLAPLTLSDFRSQYWGRRPFTTQIPAGALEWLKSELAGFDAEKLVTRNPGPLAVWFTSLEGKQTNIRAPTSAEAMALYNAGMTLFLRHGGTVPILKWHQQLAADAGHPPSPLTTSLFLSRRSAATQMHFDMLDNITIQLSGHKRWRVAANPHVKNPIENWSLGDPVPPSLAATLEGALPKSVPADSEAFDLKAGTLLYIPRGYFHATDAAADSVSLFLGMPFASWGELLLDGLRARLEQLPQWRENVWATTTPDELARARKRFEELRAHLNEDLQALEAEHFLPDKPQTLDGARRLTRNPLATLQLTLGAGIDVAVTLPLGKHARKEAFTLPAKHAAIFEWLAARPSFTVDEAVAAHPEVPRQPMVELLTVLTRAGLFT
jgi:50S ribosomal protein L16 3-hydroxylase